MSVDDRYPEIVAATVAQFQARVPSLSRRNDRGIEVGILDYEPQTVQFAPVLYGILESFTRKQKGQETIMTYIMIWRLAIKWQDNQAAERELGRFVNPIPAAIDYDQTLGGVVNPGLVTMESGVAGYINIASTLHRNIDFRLSILHKAAYKSGI